MSRRLPVYLLIDSSGSMHGEPIHAVNVGISSMLSALRQDPYALESVHISLITFDREIKELMPLTPLEEAQISDIELPRSGATHLGEGLEFLIDKVKHNVVKSSEDVKGDFRPMLFIMTDGSPSDLMAFNDAIPKLKECNFAEIIACAAGPKANTDYLKQITETVVVLDSMDSSAFAQFFKWVSDSITAGSMSAGVDGGMDNKLPPPPPEVQIVL
ncbi:vWA domain-containing protein [Agarilytica rhodophyticola]|uniref:vWA domain-containing protein n=1 Tax=Agarilytica rhodophyticola TaxID=1737490 RepID=UPI000B342CE8|nr:VWA domain-containing protein [Agarilytica rhodophyticola]